MAVWQEIGAKAGRLRNLGLTLAAFLLYAVSFHLLFPTVGGTLAALSILPVLAGSWLLGLRGGITVAFLSIALNAILLSFEGRPGWQLIFHGSGTTGSLTILIIAAAVGYTRLLYGRHTTEIAGRRQAESALRRSEDHFRTLFDENPLGTSLVDDQHRFVRVNARLCEMLGYSASELLKLSFVDITHPDDRRADNDLVSQLGAGEIPRYSIEKRYIRRDGSDLWVNLTVNIIRDGDGGAPHFLGMVEDITQRKQDQHDLQRRDNMLEALALSATKLLHNPSWQEALPEVLTQLGEASGAGRVRVLQNAADPLAPAPVQYVSEWTAPGIASTAERARQVGPQQSAALFESLTQQLARGEIVCSPRQAFPPPLQDELAAQGVHHIAAVPIHVAGAWWGQLGFDDCTGRFSFGRMEQEVFSIAASLLGAAIRREHAQDRLRRQNRELQLLNRLIAAASQPDPFAVLQIACREMAAAFDVPQAAAALLDDARETLEVVAEFTTAPIPSAVGQQIPLSGSPATQAVLREKLPLLIEDAQHDPRMGPLQQLMRERHVASTMLLPLQIAGQVVGTIGLDAVAPRHFSPEETRLAATAAATVSQVLERAHLHAATETQARQLQQIGDSIPLGLLLLDEECRVVQANALARDTLQMVGEYDEHNRLQSFGGVSLRSLLQAPLQKHLAREVTVDQPHARVFEIRTAAIEGAGWALVLHDVTVERERAAHLQAQERLAAVGQLSAGIAHDFNNILGIIVIYAQMLQAMSLPPHVLQRLQVIDEQAQRASQLVQQILDFSRKAVMQREPLDLISFLEAQLELLARTLPESIHFELHHEAGDYVVEADATRLQQVVMNLAVNARDAMPQGGRLHFALSTLPADAPLPHVDMAGGSWMRLDVSDSGSGIAPQHLPRIFEPFYTTKGPGKGSGLGLAQVYGIVRQHNGYVDVASTTSAVPDHGTTISIYLPRLSAPVPDEAPSLKAPDCATGGAMLVVEDNAIIREAIVEILQALGYEALAAANGRDAIPLYEARAGDIRLVISDMVMPHMGGKALFHHLRTVNPAIRMVLMSGYPLDEDSETFVEHTGALWLNKPFTRETLTTAIYHALAA